MSTRRAILHCFRKHQRFVLTTHIRPDGDALGSQLALGRLLQKLGREVYLINSDPPPSNLTWMPGIHQIEVFTGTLAQRERIDRADVICVLDTNALDRLGNLASAVEASRARKLLIDHHTAPENWFDLQYVRDTASSTGELVYELVRAMDPDLIDRELATALYVAIMTDTGSFRFNTVTPAVHRIAADLLARGQLSTEAIHSAIFDTRTPESMRLLGLALRNLQLRYEGKVAYMVLARRMFNETGASTEDTEGFINYLLSIRGVRVALLFTEIEKGIKVSFRSKGDYHVNAWARAFGGGGHRNAAGAFVENTSLETLVDAVLAAAPRYVPQLEADASNRVSGTLSSEDASYLSALLNQKSQASSTAS
ncbi:DHH family phosphoesterase [Rhodothermus profundi]|uniref:Phosphoesterase RecJ domain-containing protein n=1 Tax=Rhodothermus profundi TaxID=633813 RepID=A0A1M6PKR9_9BACT|nr:bifunctional oligoribonuclease/PAP phosphatase NrnA [Rhodothermus profundi]SHK08485.1 phosphoesterase RecJ domain-containing protein [Rhodothermus profundi]